MEGHLCRWIDFALVSLTDNWPMHWQFQGLSLTGCQAGHCVAVKDWNATSVDRNLIN